MRTVFLCYEMDKKTGLSSVVEVTTRLEIVLEFIKNNTSANRIEEWDLNIYGEHQGLAKTFYSIEDFAGYISE